MMAGRFPAETLARGSREITTGPARAVPIMNHIITALEGGRESEVIGFTTEAEARAAIANNR